MLAASHLHVGQLRIRWPGVSATMLRPRCERLMSGIDAPPQLSPSAILVIRRLDAPLRAAVLERGRSADGWRKQVRAALARCHAVAVRVRNGEVSPDADAVMFADEAEWLACLLLDLSRGRALERWWWRGVRPSLAGTRRAAIARQMMAHRRVAAAAVAHLASWAVLREVVTYVDDEDARAIVREISDEHRAPALRALADTEWPALGHSGTVADVIDVAPERDRDTRDSATTRSPGERHAPVPRSSSDRRAAPWDSFVAVPGKLTAAQQWCVGALLALHLAPGRARTAEFARQCRIWLATADVSTPQHETMLPEIGCEPSIACPGRAGDSTSTPHETHGAAPVLDVRDRREPDADATVIHRDGRATPAIVSVRVQSQTVETDYGGVFYLINLLSRRDTFACDAEPSDLVLSCGRWYLLTAIGIAMAGEEAYGDPLWAFLAELSHPSDAAALAAADRWVARAAPHLRSRLAGMLDVPDPDVAAELLRRRASVSVTATHVDAVFALSDVSLRVRRAGLDADPGWAPEYSRVVRFHYENR